MTPGEVNLKVVSERLAHLAACLAALRAIPAGSLPEFTADARNPAAAESFLRRGIEDLLDVARHLLARGFGLAPLEYRRVARLAIENGLVSKGELGERFELIAGFRNRLTHHYADVTPEELFRIVSERLEDLERIGQELRESAADLARRRQG